MPKRFISYRFKRAWEDTTKFLWEHIKFEIPFAIFIFILNIGYWKYFKMDTTGQQIGISLLITLGAMLSMMLLILFWNWIRAPQRIFTEQNDKIALLNKELGSLKELKLKIEYIENNLEYIHKLSSEGLSGIHHRIMIENCSNKTIEDVSIELTDMNPLHKVFERQIPLLIEKLANLNPGRHFLTVIQWIWVIGASQEYYEIITKYSTIGTKFTVDDKGHEITLTIKGKDIKPISEKFKFGIERIHGLPDKFWFRQIS